MRKNKLNIWLLIVSVVIFSLNFTPVFAQQLVLQVVGGGFRFDGPSALTFTPVAAAFTDQTGTISIRSIAPNYIEIEDQNGGSTFDVSISAASALLKGSDPSQSIALTNLSIRNIDDGSPSLTTVNGRSDGFSLNPTVNTFTAITGAVTLASGTGQQPGKWQFYPEFELVVPSGTTIGTYTTTLTFTII